MMMIYFVLTKTQNITILNNTQSTNVQRDR